MRDRNRSGEIGFIAEADEGVEPVPQLEFSEPRTRVNTEPSAGLFPDWDEGRAWRELAEFNRTHCLDPAGGAKSRSFPICPIAEVRVIAPKMRPDH